jgi:hypothetical protein
VFFFFGTPHRDRARGIFVGNDNVFGHGVP